eukprot:Skav205509  [mRNA]  locus=scaffold231:172768:176125:- [translate_table: standard]
MQIVDALTSARRQLKLALDQQETAQVQVDMAVEDLRKAKQKGDEQKVEKAKEEVKEAKKEVKEAEEKVEKAKEEVKAQQEKAIRCTASVLGLEEKVKEESLHPSLLLEKFAGDLGDLEERILNSRINNIEERPFLERDEVIQSIVAEMKKTQRLKINKPRVVCLWSPRGTGKSSVIRRLVLSDEFAESRRCGRLLIFDAAWIPTQMSVEASTLVSAMVLWHLLQLLDGYGVKLAGQVVKFERMDFATVVEVVKRRSTPLTGRLSSFEAWVRSSCKRERDVFKQWCLVTAAAFNAQQDCACLVLLDQTELLVKQTLDQQSSLGGSRSRFTEVCSQFPQQMAVYCTGTINMQVDLPAEEYTRLVIKSLPALMPLSFEGAKEAMVQWGGTQYGEEMRHCRWFFAQQFVGTQPTVSLCRAHRKGGYIDIFNAGAAFPNGDSVLVPLVWWFRDRKRRKVLAQKARELNISLEGLLPDPADLLQAPQGPLSRGPLWEEQVCNALAARFYLYCLADKKTPCDTYAPFLEIYPTTDNHLHSVLEQFSVCWSDGVEYPDEEASVLDRVGKAIKCNKNFKSAHHDLLIPVKRIETGQLEYIAAQCRYGSPKTATELTKTYQDKTRKPRTSDPSSEVPDMTNVLLQICSTSAGTQKFQKATPSTPWAKRQEEKRKATLMSITNITRCNAIIAQLHMLRIL